MRQVAAGGEVESPMNVSPGAISVMKARSLAEAAAVRAERLRNLHPKSLVTQPVQWARFSATSTYWHPPSIASARHPSAYLL